MDASPAVAAAPPGGDAFRDVVAQQGFLVLDGGLATALERQGCDLLHPLWSARLLLHAQQRPLLPAAHRRFLEAGADVATTASYQASHAGFMEHGGVDRAGADALFALSVELARRAADAFWAERPARPRRLRPLVAASLGCYGATLHDGSEFTGNYAARMSAAQLASFHAERLQVRPPFAGTRSVGRFPHASVHACRLSSAVGPTSLPLRLFRVWWRPLPSAPCSDSSTATTRCPRVGCPLCAATPPNSAAERRWKRLCAPWSVRVAAARLPRSA